MAFQTSVQNQQAPGIAGEIASTNPRKSYVSGPGGLLAGPNGLVCGAFGWVDVGTGTVVTNAGAGAPDGFVHNAHNALITIYLAQTSLLIPAGFGVGDLFTGGDFWVVNNGTTPAAPKMKAYANNTTGVASFAATGVVPTNGSGTASSIAVGAGSVTASIAVVPNAIGPGTNPGVMTVTVVGSGSINPGGALSGTGVASGTTVVQQLTGTAGGVGTYQVNTPQTVASTTITESHGVLTVGGTVTGTFAVGDGINGTGGGGVTAGTVLTALGTGTGGAGTYIVNLTQSVSSSTINAQGATESAWTCSSFGAPGEVVKISKSA